MASASIHSGIGSTCKSWKTNVLFEFEILLRVSNLRDFQPMKLFGLTRLVEFGTVVNGNKGYFVDYAASVEKFSKYLPIAQVMENSFKISMSIRVLH